jgi:hypothetical protein
MNMGLSWDDVLWDAVGSVEAVQESNTAALATVLRHGNLPEITVVLAKLMAELLHEVNAPAGAFREWAPQAASRRT